MLRYGVGVGGREITVVGYDMMLMIGTFDEGDPVVRIRWCNIYYLVMY